MHNVTRQQGVCRMVKQGRWIQCDGHALRDLILGHSRHLDDLKAPE